MKPGRVRAAPLHHTAVRTERQYPEPAVAALACPHCGEPLTVDAEAFRCPQHHAFDIARQGYVALLGARSRTDSADSAEMVAYREQFLGAGHYAPIAAAVAAAGAVSGREPTGPVLEIGAGTGYYLGAVLDAAGPSAAGIALDASRYAARRAAADHRTVSVVADAWSPLPVQDGAVAAVLSIFAPRDPAEISRALGAGGLLVVVTPRPPHLRELREQLTMVTVDDGKAERLVEKFDGLLRPAGQQDVTFALRLQHPDVASLVGMGPSARHVSAAELGSQITALPDELTVTAAVTVSSFVKE